MIWLNSTVTFRFVRLSSRNPAGVLLKAKLSWNQEESMLQPPKPLQWPKPPDPQLLTTLYATSVCALSIAIPVHIPVGGKPPISTYLTWLFAFVNGDLLLMAWINTGKASIPVSPEGFETLMLCI